MSGVVGTAATNRIEGFIPGQLANAQNSLSRAHWTVKMAWARSWHDRTNLCFGPAARERPWPPSLPKRVTFLAHVRRRFDDDGLRAALKPVRDELRALGLIQNDSPRSGHAVVYEQELTQRGDEWGARHLRAGGVHSFVSSSANRR